jgi:hypothetical protein
MAAAARSAEEVLMKGRERPGEDVESTLTAIVAVDGRKRYVDV